MFNVNSKPTFRTTIKVPAVVAEGAAPPTFQATYRALSDEEYDKQDRSTVAGVRAFLCAVIVSLDDLTDDDGQGVAYTETVRDQMLGQQYLRACLMGGYFEAITGARLGN